MSVSRNTLVISIASVIMLAWPGWLQAEAGAGRSPGARRAIIHEGARVELIGRVSGGWLTVTEGRYARQRFELVKNRTLEDLHDQGTWAVTYRIKGTVLESGGTNRILVRSFHMAPGRSRLDPRFSRGGGSRYPSGRYRDGS